MPTADILLHKKAEIEDAIVSLSLAQQMKKEAEILKTAANETLVPFMAEEGLKSMSSTILEGTVTYIKAGESKKFNKDKAVMELLNRGVSAETITAVWDAATDTSPKAAYVKFKAE